MPPRLEAPDYERLYERITQHTGLSPDKHRRADIVRVVENLMESADLSGEQGLSALLEEYPFTHKVWQVLLQTVTIGETYFFRNQAHINALRTHVLPELIKQRRESGSLQLRFWSAGCATGEEPYTLAMLLHELLPDIENWVISILATDINEAFIKYAREGLYRGRSFRNETPDQIQHRWFTPEGDAYRLKRSVRRLVTFTPLNLVADDYPSYYNGTMNLDLILCRNVTIYFDEPTTRAVISRFYEALNHQGWLVVGHSEPQTEVYRVFETRNFTSTTFYQKNANLGVPEFSPAMPQSPALVSTLRRSVRATRQPIVRRLPSVPLVQPGRKRSKEELWTLAEEAADCEKWEEALALLQEAEGVDKFQPQVYYLRALIQMQIETADDAMKSLRRAIYCDPNFALAHYTLGELYEKQASLKEASRHWHHAQSAIAGLDSAYRLPYADDLTVEMLRELLIFRLAKLERT